ncbi:MAG: 2-amino-4-hydroxy-6-hydroxymethyldihydropteridine diphosphokinase [bacterium]|nr:2-amino-4-hydroxy-6-hydroxymethyldihydropteridine diphosphokinase [Candidatus Kapabacteria bacterium]
MGDPRTSSRDTRRAFNAEPTDALLSLGANVGERVATIERAIMLIAGSPGIELVRTSSMYETAPVGYLDQPSFINAAVLIATTLSAHDLLARLRSIEQDLGRVTRERWHEREIDIDILLFGDGVVDADQLHIPHREMHRRRFVLVPAAEIAPDMHHPLLHLTVSDVLARCDDTSRVSRIEDQSEQNAE